MATEVIVPEVGEVGMDVTFVRWLKGEGEEIRAGEALFEVDTAKAVMEVEAYVDGRLADLRVGEGDLVTPHQVVALILAPGEELAAARAGAAPIGSAPAEPEPPTAEGTLSVESTSSGPAGRPGASPRARRLARDRGVDLATVRGTGCGRAHHRGRRRARGSGTCPCRSRSHRIVRTCCVPGPQAPRPGTPDRERPQDRGA